MHDSESETSGESGPENFIFAVVRRCNIADFGGCRFGRRESHIRIEPLILESRFNWACNFPRGGGCKWAAEPCPKLRRKIANPVQQFCTTRSTLAPSDSIHFHPSWPPLPPSQKLRRPSVFKLARRS